jgi:hypothetical protein
MCLRTFVARQTELFGVIGRLAACESISKLAPVSSNFLLNRGRQLSPGDAIRGHFQRLPVIVRKAQNRYTFWLPDSASFLPQCATDGIIF